MTLDTIYMISQIIASIAVILTLFPLLISIRQNTRAQLTTSVESLTAAITSINVPAMQSPELGNALALTREDWWSATREQRIMAHYFLFSYFKLMEQAWYHHRAGVLDRSQWEGWETSTANYFHSPGVRDTWWPLRRTAYSREFREFLEASKPHPESRSLADIFGPPPGAARSALPDKGQ